MTLYIQYDLYLFIYQSTIFDKSQYPKIKVQTIKCYSNNYNICGSMRQSRYFERKIRTPRKIFVDFQWLAKLEADVKQNQYLETAKKVKANEEDSQQSQLTGCSDEPQQSILLQKLIQINYEEYKDDGFLLEMIFTEIIKNHIKFIGYRPYSLTNSGSNLLMNGVFHELWWRVINKQTFLNKKQLREIYRINCYQLIKTNGQIFSNIFNNYEEDMQDNNTTNCQVQQVNKYGNNSFPLPLLPDQVDKNCLAGRSDNNQYITPVKNNNKSSSQNINQIKTNTLMNGQTNGRRISAEIVCLFLRIPISHVFSLQSVNIISVHQNYSQTQFQLAIVQAICPNIQTNISTKQKSMQNSDNSQSMEEQLLPKYCIICYKLFNLQQLIRIEHTYGEIYGFIKYDPRIDICKYLQDEMKNKQNNYS